MLPFGRSGNRPVYFPLLCESWELRESVAPSAGGIPLSESLFSVGNGVIGIRGYSEETDLPPDSSFCSHDHDSKLPNSLSAVQSVNALRSSTNMAARVAEAPRSIVTAIQIPEQSIRGTYMNGFYEQLVLNRSQPFSFGVCSKECFLVRAPDAFCIDVFIGGEHISAVTGRITSHTRVLDLRTAKMTRRMVWESYSQPREVTIESTRFASATRKNFAAVRYSVSARNVSNTEIRIVSRTRLSEDARSMYNLENMYSSYNIHNASATMLVRTQNSCRHLAISTVEMCSSNVQEDLISRPLGATTTNSSFASSTRSGEDTDNYYNNITGSGPLSATSTSSTTNGGTALAPKCTETDCGVQTTFTSCISDHVKLEMVKFVGYFGDDDAPQEELCDMATQKTRQVASMGFDALAHDHDENISAFWQTANVRIHAPNAMQGAFRFNILQSLMSASPHHYHCFPARGLTGEFNGGMHQWDVDAFIIPYFAHVNPEKARALLGFRIHTLNQARDLAGNLDLQRGALFPYRTVYGGDNPTPYCAAFLFVNGVIAYAMRQYITVTNDFSILSIGGAEVVLSTALLWLQWGTWDKGVFHLRSVSGPDEYNGVVDNNLFTNLIAQLHLQWVAEIAALFRETQAELWQRLLMRCSMTEDDVDEMSRAAAKIAIFFDADHRVHPVDQFFMRKKKWNFDRLKDHHQEPISYRYHPNVIYRHQLCKISDVMLAVMLMPDKFTTDEAKANLKFYEPITTLDSALNLTIFSVVASRLRLTEKATHYFNQALLVDIDNIIGNTGGGLHCTTAAGSWWALTAGFAGMKVVDGVLHFNPYLPEECGEIQFHVRHHGCLVRVCVTQRLVTYTLMTTPTGAEDLFIVHGDVTRLHLEPRVSETIRLLNEFRVFNFNCIIFELDSILDDIEANHYNAWKLTLEEFFHRTGNPDFEMTKELYLAYLRHGTPFSGLNEICKKYDLPLLPHGEPSDAVSANTLYGLCNRKLQIFRADVQQNGLKFREGVFGLLNELRQSELSVGCVTGSKNGMWLIAETPQLRGCFDECLDGNLGEDRGLRWRPEMDYFEACALNLKAAPSRTVVVMDGIDGFSKSSVEQFSAVVNVSTEPEETTLFIPCLATTNFTDVTLDKLDRLSMRDDLAHNANSPLTRISRFMDSFSMSPLNNSSHVPNSPSLNPSFVTT